MFWYSPCCLKVRWQMQILERWPGFIFSSSSLVQRIVRLLESVRSLPPLFLLLCLGAWLWESLQYINSQYNFVWADLLVFAARFAHCLFQTCFIQLCTLGCLCFGWNELQMLSVCGEFHLSREPFCNSKDLIPVSF